MDFDKMKNLVLILAMLILSGCSGYRYEIVENDNEYLLKGEYYNNNPFVTVKALIPNSYLIRKTPNNIAIKDDIKSTQLREEEIIGGYIIDRNDEAEIRLLVYDGRSGDIRTAYENGNIKIENRKTIQDIEAYIKNNEKYINEKMFP